MKSQVTVEPLPLRLATPFRIAHGTSTTRTNALVRLGDVFGEAALPPYYPYTFDDITAYVDRLDVESLTASAFYLEDALDALPDGPATARCAIDIALHDAWGKALGQPLFRLWGLNPSRAPATSITLAIPDDETGFREQLYARRGWPMLKLKLGTGSIELDEELVRIAREETNGPLCVDANSAWSVEDAALIIPRLAAFQIAFIEQPITGNPAAWHDLRRRLTQDAPPLFADESVQTTADVLALVGAIDGINVKLAKTGGLRGARRLIMLARSLGLRVMLGCMVESTLAVTAAAHLAPLADYADLDAPLLVADDPFMGVRLDNGQLIIPDSPGLGVRVR